MAHPPIPQGAAASMTLVGSLLKHNLTQALEDIKRSVAAQNAGEFAREFPIAGSKWTIRHEPLYQGTLCVGYTVKITQNWRSGHVPAHFDIVRAFLEEKGYDDIGMRLNCMSGIFLFPS